MSEPNCRGVEPALIIDLMMDSLFALGYENGA